MVQSYHLGGGEGQAREEHHTVPPLPAVMDAKQLGAQAFSVVHALHELLGHRAAARALASLSRPGPLWTGGLPPPRGGCNVIAPTQGTQCFASGPRPLVNPPGFIGIRFGWAAEGGVCKSRNCW